MKSKFSLLIVVFALSGLAFGQMTPVGEKAVKQSPAAQQPIKVIPLTLPPA